jgi:hypothetical protein
MAKTARKNRKRNARRKERALRATMRGDGEASRPRNEIVLGMILHCKGGRFQDRKKKANKKACRGSHRGEE